MSPRRSVRREDGRFTVLPPLPGFITRGDLACGPSTAAAFDRPLYTYVDPFGKEEQREAGESRTDWRPAKRLCRACPAAAECLSYALRHRIDTGVWGGLTPHERGIEATRRNLLEAS